MKNIEEEGIVYIGEEVNNGEIIVGKIKKKGERKMKKEEKIMREILGEKE